MKKLSILFAFLIPVFVSGVSSQTVKGQYLLSFSNNIFGTDIGSSIAKTSYSWYNYEKTHFTAVQINPRFGYFLTNNFVVGLDVALSYTSTKSGTNLSSTATYGAGPFVRFYTSPAKRFSPFIEANGTLLNIKNKSHLVWGDNESLEGYFNAFGGIGLSYCLKEVMAFEVLGGYACYMRTDKTNGETYYNLNSLALKVGVSIVLSKKPKK